MENKDTITAGKRFTVYGLVNTRTGSIRYIGMTENPQQRARQHRQKYPTLELQVIGECESHDEMAWWEWMFILAWQPPLNEIPGGGVNPMKDPKVAAKRCGANNPMRRPEVRAKMSTIVKKAMKRPEVRAKLSANNPMKRPEVRAKISAAKKKQYEDPAYRAKLSANNAMKRPEVRAKQLAAKRTPEARAKVSESMKRVWAERRAGMVQ